MQLARPQRGSGGSSRSLCAELVKVFLVSVSRGERQTAGRHLAGWLSVFLGVSFVVFLFFLSSFWFPCVSREEYSIHLPGA